MEWAGKKRRKSDKGGTFAEGTEAGDLREGDDGRPGGGRADRRILSYGLTVLAVMACFYGLYWSESLVEQRWFYPILKVQAEGTRWLLMLVGNEVSREGNLLIHAAEGARSFQLVVGLGCEAFDVTVLAMVGILCFPAPWRRRLTGALLAGAVVQSINLVRLASLYLVGLHAPRHFDFVHHNLWQALLILCVIGVWWGWLTWPERKDSPRQA